MNDKAIDFKTDFAWYLSPISVFDPLGASSKPEGYNVKSSVVKNDNAKFSINY
jgi:alpha-glucosidase